MAAWGPNPAHHLSLDCLGARNVFYIPKWLEKKLQKKNNILRHIKFYEFQVSVSINIAALFADLLSRAASADQAEQLQQKRLARGGRNS